MNFDILTVKENTATQIIEAGKLTGRKSSEVVKYGVRRFENQKLFQTSYVGESSRDELLAENIKNGGPGIKHDFGFAKPAKEFREVPVNVVSENPFYEIVKPYFDKYPDYVFHGKCSQKKFSKGITSDYGVELGVSGSSFDWYIEFQRKNSGNMIDGYFGAHLPVLEIASEFDLYEPFLSLHGKEAKINAGLVPVMFRNPFAPLSKLVESFILPKYKENSCVYAGKLQEKLFAEKLTMFDRAWDPDHAVVDFFDGEGVTREHNDLTLIENGVFKNLLCDLRYGKKYGLPSSGNALRSFNSGVSIGPKDLRLSFGQRPWQKIIADLETFIFIDFAVGGDSNDLGEFSTPVQAAYVYRYGKLMGQAPQFSLKTNANDYLGKYLVDISSDSLRPASQWPCLISQVEITL